MIIAYSYAPVVEEILIDKITKYLYEDCQWSNLYKNYAQVRINNEYPWVPFMSSEEHFTNGWLDLNKVSEQLFPAITIIGSSDEKTPTMFVAKRNTALEKDEFDEFVAQSEKTGYIIAPNAIAAVNTHFEGNEFLYGVTIDFQKRDSISLDIVTDDNTNIKNRLYDLLNLYAVGHGNLELRRELNIKIDQETVQGNRSGTYNVDFGRTLRGSSIRFMADYGISQTFYNTDATVISDIEIDHTVSLK